MAQARIPLATYRLQFNSGFTFRDATAITDYLDRLGISDCYASSYLTAIPGSPHGYDVVDPTALNPDIGTSDDYQAWVQALRSHGMGHILDLVPNHMGIAKSANRWWQDVLESGPSSRFAHFFDIEWRPIKHELADRVLIPILGDQYGAVLERQELRLAYEGGAFVIRYFDVTLPVAPDTYAAILRHDLDALDEAVPSADLDELKSIVTASEQLPSRTLREAEHIAIRAREKEIVKRRLAALTGSSPRICRHVESAVTYFNGTLGRPASFDTLDRLLAGQSYRLAHWRVASEEINYRRFFDVNDLAALRMEDPLVFEEVHRFVFELIRSGAATGLRIDHVDGLYAPADYLHRLQRRAAEVMSAGDSGLPFFIVVEKILGAGERLPADWPIHGTTGYEFSTAVNNLFVDRRSEEALDEIYARFTRERRGLLAFADLAFRSKTRILHETMSSDINGLGHQLNRFSERNRHFRDFTLYSLISTLKQVVACFPVYRTYVTETGPVSERDRHYIVEAVRDAQRRAPEATGLIFAFVERLLLKETPTDTQEECEERARFIGKFQQVTGPVAAKGIEDTAFYIYNRLVSLNDVGSDPTQFGIEPSVLHEWLSERSRQWPHGLSSTSTHDAKRGEDVRARLNVLSEIPGAWKAAVAQWRTVNRRFKTEVQGTLAPGANEEYLLYQTLVGAWPFDADDDDARRQFRDRIFAYMLKAMREAKVHTSWLSPNNRYERAVRRFVEGILDPRRTQFLETFEPFQARVAQLGIYNSLAQLAIKITAPGVPDFYQGTELWDLNLVDPDNRRPVDYAARMRALEWLDADVSKPVDGGASASPAEEVFARRTDGHVKLFVAARSLAARRQWRGVYERGEYIPLPAAGARRDSVFAFARREGESVAITCVPRLIASVIPDGTMPPLGSVWLDTRVELPEPSGPAYRGAFRNVYTNARIEPETMDGVLAFPVPTLFDRFPIAHLVPCST